MGLAVDTHERWFELTCFGVREVYDTAEVSRFFQVALILLGETVSLVFEVEVGSGLHQVRHKAHRTVLLYLEGEAGGGLEGLPVELRGDAHQVGLAIVEHPFQIARLLQLVAFDAPFLFQLLPVDFTLVDGFVGIFLFLTVAVIRFLLTGGTLCCLQLFLFLFHFFCGICGLLILLLTLWLFFLYCLMIRRHVDFVRGEQFTVAFGILEQIFHHFDELVRLLGCHAVEAEAGGLLALPHEVEEEVVQDVAPTVELQEVLSVLCFRRHTLGGSVTAEPGDDTDLSRLLVADEQDVLFFCFLCHFYLRLFCCLFNHSS